MNDLIKKDIDKRLNNEAYIKFENVYNAGEEIITQLIRDYKQNGKIDDINGFIKHKVMDYEDSCDMFYRHDAESHIIISFLQSDLAGLLNFLKCAHKAGVDIKDYFRHIVKTEWKIEKDLDAKFNTHPALQPHIYNQLLQLNQMLEGVNLDHLLYSLTNDKKSINDVKATDLLYFYAKEIVDANGNEQEIENVMKKIITWFARPISYHADKSDKHKADKEEEWKIFTDAMRVLINAIPKEMVKQRNFVHKILIHKNEVISRERLQSSRVDSEIIDKMKHGRLPRNIEEQESVKKEIYNRHMQPVRNYEIGYNEFLNSIDTKHSLNYDELFKGMDAVEHDFSLAVIQAVLEGRR